jgi:hypothetical protein
LWVCHIVETGRREQRWVSDRNLLALRYVEVEMELAHIAEGGVVDGDWDSREWVLLGELEGIEFRLGAESVDGPLE